MDQVMELPTLPEFVAELDARLTAERERRRRFYEGLPDGAKWEFINGETVMHSPDRVVHMAVRARLERLLSAHVDARGMGLVLGEKGLCVFPRNDFMPDVIYFGTEKAAGLQPGQVRLPIPDLAVEVLSESTASRDRGVKFRDYEAHGVREYWLVDPEAESLEQYVLGQGGYALVVKSGDGRVRSRVIEGFEIPIRALFDATANLTALRGLLEPV